MSLSRESPNSRLNMIRKFLSQAPPGSNRLRLVQVRDTPIPLGEWMPLANADARETLAEEIEQLLLDTAAEKRRHRTEFLLAWCDETGGQKAARELTVYAHQLPRLDDTPEDTVRDLDGSTQSQLAQTQRHLEAMMRMKIQNDLQMFGLMANTIDRLTERCAQMETQHGVRHDELLKAKETILGLLNEAAENDLTPAQLKAFELIDKYGPTLAMWFQSQAHKNNAAKAANGKHSNGEGKAAA